MTRKRAFVLMMLWALFVVCAVGSLYIMFKAGCMGDTKTGIFGNPSHALEIESTAMAINLLSVVVGFIVVALQSNSRYWLAYAVAFAVFALMGLSILGIQLESFGVQSCFNP